MYLSHETSQQTEIRLRRLLADADLVWHEGSYAFFQFSSHEFPVHAVSDSLAFVRDADVWSVSRPSGRDSDEIFAGTQAYGQCLAPHRECPFEALRIWARDSHKACALDDRLTQITWRRH
jgi:hypothetical protein